MAKTDRLTNPRDYYARKRQERKFKRESEARRKQLIPKRLAEIIARAKKELK